jgi:drug/metabolite transporter (DMT)-like permease
VRAAAVLGSGTALCLISAGLLGMQIPFARLAYDSGAGPVALALLRAVLSAVLFLVLVRLQGLPLALPRSLWPALFLIALGTAVISYGYLGSVQFIPAGLAALIFYLFPLLVMLADAVRAREIPGPRRIAILVTAFAGLALVFGPSWGTLDPVGIALALLAALGATVYYLLVPGAAGKAPAAVLLSWTNILVAVFFLPALAFRAASALPDDSVGWAWFMVSALTYAVGLGMTIPAIARSGSVQAAVLYNLEPLMVVLTAAVLLGEVLSWQQYLGGAVVLSALVLASARSVNRG